MKVGGAEGGRMEGRGVDGGRMGGGVVWMVGEWRVGCGDGR